jgi:hypothetical protein
MVATTKQCRSRRYNYTRLSGLQQRRLRNNEIAAKAKKSKAKIFADNTNYADDGDVYQESVNLGAERQLEEWEGHMAEETEVDPISHCDPMAEEEDNWPFEIQPAVRGT